jgi:hypothetical protein
VAPSATRLNDKRIRYAVAAWVVKRGQDIEFWMRTRRILIIDGPKISVNYRKVGPDSYSGNISNRSLDV